jgi:hypothetical protein
MSIVSELLAEVEAFLEDANLTKTAFGRAAMSDGKFVDRLRAGKGGVTTTTVEKVRRYIAGERAKMAFAGRRAGAARKAPLSPGRRAA